MSRRLTAILIGLLAPVSLFAAGENAECSAQDRADYLEQVLQDIKASWKIPHTHKSIVCTILIKQNFRGEVDNVGIANCGDDPVVHRSIVNAGYRASPMPPPANGACFSRDLIVKLESTTGEL